MANKNITAHYSASDMKKLIINYLTIGAVVIVLGVLLLLLTSNTMTIIVFSILGLAIIGSGLINKGKMTNTVAFEIKDKKFFYKKDSVALKEVQGVSFNVVVKFDEFGKISSGDVENINYVGECMITTTNHTFKIFLVSNVIELAVAIKDCGINCDITFWYGSQCYELPDSHNVYNGEMPSSENSSNEKVADED